MENNNNAAGPPGVGKTHAVREAARRAEAERGLRVYVHVINGGELLAAAAADADAGGADGGGSGGGVEAAIRGAFAQAKGAAAGEGGHDAALLFLDEIEALCPAASLDASVSRPASLSDWLDS